MPMPVKGGASAAAEPSNAVVEPIAAVEGEVLPPLPAFEMKDGEEVVSACGSTAAPPARRPPATAWAPGQSGNPSGRRKQDPQIVALLKDKSLSAAQTLVQLMESPSVSPKVRAQAAEAILDRVYGKAVQPIDATVGGNGDPIMIQFMGVIKEWAQ